MPDSHATVVNLLSMIGPDVPRVPGQTVVLTMEIPTTPEHGRRAGAYAYRPVRAWTLALLLLPAFTLLANDASEPEEDDDVPTPLVATMQAGYIDGTIFAQRSMAFLRHCATAKPRRDNYPKEAMAYFVARLLLGTDTEYARTKLDAAAATTLKRTQGRLKKDPRDTNAFDPFDQHALVNGYAICPGKFPPATAAKIRQFIALYGFREWRGFGSLNYRLMRDGSGYMAADLWPDLKDADGLAADAIKSATAQRLYACFDTMTHRNLDEYNAPIYFATDLMPVRMLAEFARDPEMKRRATLTLDWMMVNMACSWNQGYYVTTAGRSKYWGSAISSPDGMGATAQAGWFHFGGRRPIAADSGAFHSFWMAYPGTYRLPAIVERIAKDRQEPFTSRESVLSIGKTDVRKTTWHSRSYSLASQWEKTPGPTSALYKETKRQMMKWISDKPVSTFAVQQENPQRPYKRGETITNAFGYGENPFGQLLQHEGTQIGVYNVPDDYLFHRFYVPFPQSGAIVKRAENSNWIFCHGGSVLFAFRTIKPYTWGKPREACDVLWCDARKNGWILETSEVAPYAGGEPVAELARFASDVLKKTSIDASGLDAKTPRLRYTSLTGHTLDIVYMPHAIPYTNQHQIDGKPVDYRAFPLMGNPWVQQAADGDVLTLNHGGETRTYDFKRWQLLSGPDAPTP